MVAGCGRRSQCSALPSVMEWEEKGNGEIQGSLHCGGKSAALHPNEQVRSPGTPHFGRDDVLYWWPRVETTCFWSGTMLVLLLCPCFEVVGGVQLVGDKSIEQ